MKMTRTENDGKTVWLVSDFSENSAIWRDFEKEELSDIFEALNANVSYEINAGVFLRRA